MGRRFKKRRGGGVRVSLGEPELELLRTIPGQLSEVLSAPPDPDDPVRTRLFPRAYLDPTDEDSEREWQELVHPELVRERLAALELLTASLDRAKHANDSVSVDLTAEEAEAWLGVLNDARLALGTRLGVSEEPDVEMADEDSPAAAGQAVYQWLTWIQGELVDTLLG
jgi:hypothetical protein